MPGADIVDVTNASMNLSTDDYSLPQNTRTPLLSTRNPAPHSLTHQPAPPQKKTLLEDSHLESIDETFTFPQGM